MMLARGERLDKLKTTATNPDATGLIVDEQGNACCDLCEASMPEVDLDKLPEGGYLLVCKDCRKHISESE